MRKLVACGEFVKRQTPESGFSHFIGSWEELELIVSNIMTLNKQTKDNAYIKPGYKDGVVLVDITPGYWFRSAIVALNEQSKMTANYAPRRDGEAPFIRVSAKAKKQVAKYASVVLYRRDVLEENNEQSVDADWEIVCIKARVTEEEEPMDPYTMARNFLHLEGGTKGDFSAQQFAESIVYWNNNCMTTGTIPWYKKAARKIGEVGLYWWQSLPEREKL